MDRKNTSTKIWILAGTNVLTLIMLLALFLRHSSFFAEKPEEQPQQEAPKEEAPPPYSFTQNGKYMEQTDFYTVFPTKSRIVMLGNSHTYRMYWNELLQRNDIANRGIGSDITEGYINRLWYVLKVKPRICFIEGGGNDIYFKVPIDTIVHNLDTIVLSLKKRKIIPVLTHLFLAGKSFPNVDSSGYNLKVVALNSAVDSLARQRHVEVISLDSLLNDGSYMSDEFVQKDGIHLNSKGYAIWGNAVKKVLKKHGI